MPERRTRKKVFAAFRSTPSSTADAGSAECIVEGYRLGVWLDNAAEQLVEALGRAETASSQIPGWTLNAKMPNGRRGSSHLLSVWSGDRQCAGSQRVHSRWIQARSVGDGAKAFMGLD